MSEQEDIEEFEIDSEEELFEEDDDAARVAAASAEVAAWEREHGIELSDADFNHVATQVDLYGLTPEAAYGSTEDGRFEAEYEASLEAVERERGYKLLDGEREAIWEAAVQASEDPSIETDAQVWGEARKATSDLLATSDGVAAYLGERLAVPAERQEASAVTEDDQPSFNVDDPDERAAAIDAAMSGETVSTHGDDELAEDA